MRIAATYDNGNIFQHFGRTEYFKLYDVEDGKVTASHVISSEGSGHEALAGVLAGQDVDLLICGGIGGGAQAALAEAGIALCAGAQGNTDEAVEAYLKGELVNSGVNCDHHHGEGHHCGHHDGEGHCGHHGHETEEAAQTEETEDGDCGGSCGGGCGGCAGCGGEQELLFEGPNAGKTCRVHYRGTFNDGTQFDSSYDRGEPLEFVCAVGMMISGFDAAVVNMEVGQVVDIHLMPEEAYGMPDPERIFTVETALMPGSEKLEIGQMVYLSNSIGQRFPAKVTAKEGTTITFDANHEMAGKELNFRIELVEVKED